MITGLAGGLHQAYKAIYPATLTRHEQPTYAPLPPVPLKWLHVVALLSLRISVAVPFLVPSSILLDKEWTILLIAISFHEPPLEAGVQTVDKGRRD